MKKTINIIYIFTIAIIIALGIFLRINLYREGIPLWRDEIALVLSVLKHNIFFSFGELEVCQKCPPLILFFTFINKYLFGYSVYIIRLIPFISGILSIFAFYILCKDIYKNKFSQIMAFALFAICAVLVYYTQEFKQYSSDVLFCILLIISYKYIDIKNANLKKIILYSFTVFLLPFLSFPSLFIIPAIGIMKFLENKNSVKKFIPIILGYVLSAIYFIVLYGNLWKNEIKIELWTNGFIDFSIDKITLISDNFFRYMDFNPKIGALFALAGIIIFIAKKHKQGLLMLLIILFATIASYFKIYPLYERVILYLIPIALIAIVMPIDYFISDLKNSEWKKTITKIFFAYLLSIILLCSLNYKQHNILNPNSYCYNQEYKLRIEEQGIYKNFLEKYKENENILTFIAIYDLDYQGIINNYKYNFYDVFIPIRTPNDDIISDIDSHINELSPIYWIILDKLLMAYKDDVEKYLNENNFLYEKFASSEELNIYRVKNRK